MQKFSQQPSDAVTPQSPAAPGLFSRPRHGKSNAPAPKRQSPARYNRHQPTSTAMNTAVVAAAKASWLPRAPAHWPDEPKLAPANPSCPPKCDACDRLRSWPYRSHVAPFFGCLDALAVQDHRCWLSAAPISKAHLFMQRIMQLFPRSIQLPASKTRIHRAPSRKLARQITPLAAGSQHIQNRIHHRAPWHTRRTAKVLFDKRLDAMPLLVGQVAWIAFSHTASLNNS